MKKILIPCSCLLILCIVCSGVIFFVYNALKNGDYSNLGFLSTLSGSQQELGVAYSENDALQFLSGNNFTATNTCPAAITCSSTGPTYSGTQAVDTTLTNAQGTALINEWIKLSKNAPFSSAQMRVNNDGSVDFSATVDLNRLKNFGSASHIPADLMDTATKFVGVLGNSFPLSASGTLTVTNNKVDANFSNFKVGFLPVPGAILSGQKDAIDSFIEDRLQVVQGLSIQELSFSGGKTTFKGTLPQTIVYVK
jgi:hypothetical protein